MRSDRNGDRPERALCSKQKRGKIALRLGPPLAPLLGKKYEGPKWSAPHGLRNNAKLSPATTRHFAAKLLSSRRIVYHFPSHPRR